ENLRPALPGDCVEDIRGRGSAGHRLNIFLYWNMSSGGVERAHGREAVLSVEQVAEEERDADVAGKERVAAAADRLALALDLTDRVHREGARPVEPELVARPPVEDEERVGVAGRPVTEARPLGKWAGPPRQFAARERELEIEQVAERPHHPGSSVAP